MKAVIVALAAGIVVCGVVRAEDWPNWRGSGRDGISQESGWFKPDKGSKVVWEGQVGAGYSGIVVKGGKLYTMGHRDGKDVVSCLEAGTGKSIWAFEYAAASGSYPGPRGTPAADGSSVYVVSRDAEVLCLDSGKGNCLWRRDLRAEMKVNLPTWGISGSPVVAGELLIVSVGSRGMVMDKKAGTTKWDSGGSDSGYASPVLAGEGARRALVVFGAKSVSASDLATGRKLWEHPWVTSYNVNAADPIVLDGRVFITSGYGRGGALLDVSGGKPAVVWENKNMGSHFSTPVVLNGFAYSGHGNTGSGSIRCIDVRTGELKWESAAAGYGSVLLADGKLLILGDKGMLAVAEATPDKYQELWKSKVLDGTCWTVPTLCNGLVYCRNDKGRLLCLDLK